MLPERGKDAKAVNGKGFLVLNTTRNFLHCLSPFHGTCELKKLIIMTCELNKINNYGLRPSGDKSYHVLTCSTIFYLSFSNDVRHQTF